MYTATPLHYIRFQLLHLAPRHDQSSSGAGTHRNAVPFPFWENGSSKLGPARSVVVIRGARVTRVTLMLLETDYLLLIITRCDNWWLPIPWPCNLQRIGRKSALSVGLSTCPTGSVTATPILGMDRLGCPPNTMSPLPRLTPTPNVNSIRWVVCTGTPGSQTDGRDRRTDPMT